MSEETAQQALVRANEANNRLDGHEELCAERYRGILQRMQRQEWLLWGMVLLLLIGEGTVTEVLARLVGK